MSIRSRIAKLESRRGPEGLHDRAIRMLLHAGVIPEDPLRALDLLEVMLEEIRPGLLVGSSQHCDVRRVAHAAAQSIAAGDRVDLVAVGEAIRFEWTRPRRWL